MMPTYTVREKTSGNVITFNWNKMEPPTQDDMLKVYEAAGKWQPSKPVTEPKQEGSLVTLPNKRDSEIPPGLTPDEYFKRTGGTGEISEPGFFGTLVNPVEMLSAGGAGGIIARRLGKPVAKEIIDWMLAGGPSLGRGVKGGAKTFLEGLSAKAREAAIPVEKAVPHAVEMPKVRPDFIASSGGTFIRPGIQEAQLEFTRHKIKPEYISSTEKPIPVGGVPRRIPIEKIEEVPKARPQVQPAEIKPQVTPNEVLVKQNPTIISQDVHPSLLPTQPTPELTKDELEGLKKVSSEAFEMVKPFKQKLRETPLKLQMEIQSPYEVFAKEPTGKGWQFWKFSEKQDRAKSLFIHDTVTEFEKKVKVAPGSPSAGRVGEWLDQFENWKDIPDVIKSTATKEEKGAFNYLRQKWSMLGDELVAKGYMEPTRKIRAYLFRMFDKDKIYQAWKDELPILQAELSLHPTDGKLLQKLHKLEAAIDGYEKTGAVLYDYIPKSISAPFLKKRLGGTGYSLDAVDAYRAYLNYFAKKIYDEPVAKMYYQVAPQLPELWKGFAHDYTRRFLGLGKEGRLADIARSLTMMEYLKDLGFNLRSALTNATQHLNTVIDLGPKGLPYMMKAFQFGHTPEGKALWNASGHALEVPELRYGFMTKLPQKVMEIPFYLFDKVERGNRKMAYLSGYLKAVHEGKGLEAAREFADDVVRRTQFLYGRTGSPLILSTAGGKVFGQFSTYSLKQLELMMGWAKKNPLKFASYLVVSSAITEGLKGLGLDMSNALGIGIDSQELYKSFRHLGAGEWEAARLRAKAGLPKNIPFPGLGTSWKTGYFGLGEAGGSGIFPSGIAPSIETLKSVMKGEWTKEIPVQVERVMTALRSLGEGEVTTLEGQKGFPIRPPFQRTLKHVETLPQLLVRTFAARPTAESDATKKMMFRQLLTESQNEKMRGIAELYLDGELVKAGKLAEKYGWPSSQMVEAVRSDRERTAGERSEKRVGKGQRVFKEMIGEKEK